MTSDVVAAYGGVVFPPEALEQVAEALRSGTMPLHVDHDLRKPMRIRNLDAYVRERADGIHELRFTVDVHPDDVLAFGDRKGMSTTIMVPLDRDDGYREPTNPSLEIAADAAWFPDVDLIAAEGALVAIGIPTDQIRTERALQFGFTPDPQIFVTIPLDLLISVGASALWAGIVRLFRGRKTPDGGVSTARTKINVTVTKGDRSVTAVVETNDEAIASRAIDALEVFGREALDADHELPGDRSELPSRPPVAVWSDPSRRWVPPT